MAKKKKLKKVKPVEIDEDNVIFNIDADEANADWIRAARLLKKANQGDKEAGDKLEKLFNTPMHEEDE